MLVLVIESLLLSQIFCACTVGRQVNDVFQICKYSHGPFFIERPVYSKRYGSRVIGLHNENNAQRGRRIVGG